MTKNAKPQIQNTKKSGEGWCALPRSDRTVVKKWLSYNWWTLSHTHTHINTLITPTTNKFKLTRYERQYTLTHIHKYQRYFYERERTNLLRPCRRKRTRVFLQSKAKVVFCVFTLIQNESKLLTIYDLRYHARKCWKF